MLLIWHTQVSFDLRQLVLGLRRRQGDRTLETPVRQETPQCRSQKHRTSAAELNRPRFSDAEYVQASAYPMRACHTVALLFATYFVATTARLTCYL